MIALADPRTAAGRTMARLISNGRYHVRISPSGGGQSRWRWIALTRWTNDPVMDQHGFFIFLRDLESNRVWPATWAPSRCADRCHSSYSPGKFRCVAECGDLTSALEVTVCPREDAECRSVRLRNGSDRVRRIELTSCVEVALHHPMGDLNHPAFSKLFVQTESLTTLPALAAKRRPRSSGENWPVMLHAVTGAQPAEWETDRLQFFGRGRTLADAAALQMSAVLSGTVGNVLDPALCLRTTVELPPHGEIEVTFLLAVAPTVEEGAAILARLGVKGPPLAMPPQSASRVEISDSGGENGYGDFSPDGSEYVIRLSWQGRELRLPPMPWCNVLANERFGCLVSERGPGCTWSRNSQANRLTPWSNDPVTDPPSDGWWIRQHESQACWSATPGPNPAPVDYEVRHGFGYSEYAATVGDLSQRLTVFVPQQSSVKVSRLRLANQGTSVVALSVYFCQRLVLGTLPPQRGRLRTWEQNGVLCAQNPEAGDFRDGTTFSTGKWSGLQPEETRWCLDRSAFYAESTLLPREMLPQHATAEDDACFGWQWQLRLPPGATAELWLLLGESLSATEQQDMVDRFTHSDVAAEELAAVREFWGSSLGRLRVQTPSAEINAAINGWLPYQALACRIWGRTAFYQSSGAYGFRDQLQDAGNLTLLWPELARRQILLHASQQFVEGDVLHWWHPAPLGRGVRTRFSDDLLWLPWVTANYVRATGDRPIWDEEIPFLVAPLLEPSQEENYLLPEPSHQSANLYEHCCRAIDHSLKVGSHGLPLMGTGDWNDGMNRVGREGRGESVWLGFFLYQILGDFIQLARFRGEATRMDRYAVHLEKLRVALNDAGWDGGWYRRAYYDNGHPLGVAGADECRIDGLAQSWAALSGAAPPERAAMAMQAAVEALVSEQDGIIRLLTPPFVHTPDDPGYIKGYVAGVRENGGQYTHAACWVIEALAKVGQRNLAAHLLKMVTPAAHAASASAVDRYKVEPYVVAADIYGAEPHIGRGGWTWYTGSAGWLFRVAVESILGLRLEGGDTLVVRPCIPDNWPEYTITYAPPGLGLSVRITVQNPHGCTEAIRAAHLNGTDLAAAGEELRLRLVPRAQDWCLVITLGPRA